MVLAFLGKEFSERKVRRLLNSKPHGTPGFATQKLTKIGINVTYQEWSVPSVLQLLDAGFPLIVSVRTEFFDYYADDFAHAVVIIGADQAAHFWVNDPYQPEGSSIVSWDGLLAGWAEFSYRGSLLTL